MKAPSAETLAGVFNATFEADRVQMQGGGQEPLYLPAQAGAYATLRYREDFAASVLHEAAHWCIAGSARREREDFGYSYLPPPRNAAQQAAFYNSELRAQSLEAVFARCCGVAFVASADNLEVDVAEFAQRVLDDIPRTKSWLQTASGIRARKFCDALRMVR